MPKTVNIRLLKRWSDWNEGNVVAVDPAKAKRMIAKGYGVEDRSKEAARIADVEVRGAPPQRHPVVETAVATPAAERADVTPETGTGGQGASAISEAGAATAEVTPKPAGKPGKKGPVPEPPDTAAGPEPVK